MSIDATLLYASGAAYDIDPVSGQYDPSNDLIFAPKVGFVGTPQAITGASIENGPLINACLVGATSDAIIVAFRGTIPNDNTIGGVEDWLQDFFAEPKTCGSLPGLVHSGFCTGLNSIFSQILAAVQDLIAEKSSGVAVYVTGHSKGGGLAPLAVWKLEQAGVTVTRAITFAGPKCGDATFQLAYNAKYLDKHLRYENFGDLVPLCPPSDGFIKMIANVFYYVSKDIYNLIEDAAGWNYVPVGQEAYIEAPNHGLYDIDYAEPVDLQVGDFILNAAWAVYEGDLVNALLNAHSHDPGHGYFDAVCPGLKGAAPAPALVRRRQDEVDPRLKRRLSPAA